MNITTSIGITAVLALTISCARAKARPTEAEPQASPAAAPTTAAAPTAAAALARYAGEYDVNGSTMTIRAKGDVLIRQMSGQVDQVLRPIGKSESRFRVGTTTHELEFRSESSGKMTLIWRAGKHEAQGVRVRQL